ncbi:hypothetical protein [Vibrio sp. 16]|uniref:hypothetical protein n=1 Tax=Vibrio sp. 16 TaxID=391586 RepID=UPI00018F1DE1|nr:hypothetical protein [Vibrio sp. 16]EED25397.1 hypothetical protein VPMS16_2767 [Vibrio sp. 16]CAK4076557.1 hypothetical protein PVDT1_37 [Vibrio sp. 16]
MKKVMQNAKRFAQVLCHNGVSAYVVDDQFPIAQQVIIRWSHPEGAHTASYRLAKVGIFVQAIPLVESEGLHFSLRGITRLGISEADLDKLGATAANVLLGSVDLEEARSQVRSISSRLSLYPTELKAYDMDCINK